MSRHLAVGRGGGWKSGGRWNSGGSNASSCQVIDTGVPREPGRRLDPVRSGEYVCVFVFVCVHQNAGAEGAGEEAGPCAEW
jgi:hypothetical protein